MRQAVLEAPLHKLGWDRMIGSALSLSLSRPLVVPQPCLPASQSPAAAVARGAARRAMEQPGQPALAGKRARTAAASAPFFPSISKIRYEGPESLNPLAFKYYQPDELVMGKKMRQAADMPKPSQTYLAKAGLCTVSLSEVVFIAGTGAALQSAGGIHSMGKWARIRLAMSRRT